MAINQETCKDPNPTDDFSGGGESVTTQADPPAVDGPLELSPEQIELLRTKAVKADETWNQLLRVSADFDNYKKRATRDRQEAIRFANEALLEKLIPVLDNFEMALLAANDPKGSTADALKTGINMIYSQLKNVAAKAGLEEIDATQKTFDPNWHEAVSQRETSDAPEGQVLQQLRKGYKLRDRLLRPAGVIVAKAAGTEGQHTS